jgi:hypothetical protein
MNIDAYSFGRIKIDGIEYYDDVIITPLGVKPEWWRKHGHKISVFDLAELLMPAPERLIIGTGASGMCEVQDEVKSYCRLNSIELIAAPTPEAVVEYNSLEDKSKTVVALHLTC